MTSFSKTLRSAFSAVIKVSMISALPCSFVAPEARAQPRVMCLGDSITDGFAGFASYRYHLWRDLQANGIAIDFVGPRTATGYNVAPGQPDTGQFGYYSELWASFDRDQAGYAGYRTDQLEAGVPTLANQFLPDIVLIHAGGNDLFQLQDAGIGIAEQNLRDIISLFRQRNPSTKILLSTNIPRGDGVAVSLRVPQLNQRIALIVSQMNTSQSPVRLVDVYSGFDLNSMMQGDLLHPNTAGEQFMADIFRRELAAVLGDTTPCPVIPSPTPSSSLVALYTFDDGSMRDVSPSDNKLWPGFGTPQITSSGYEGGGLSLNGSSYLRADVLIDPFRRPQLTMGAWVRLAVAPSEAEPFTLLSHDNRDFDRTLAIDWRSGFGWSVFRGLGFGNGVLGALPFVTNQWQFVASVYDITTGQVTLYVDGQTLTASAGPCSAPYQLSGAYLQACACGQNLWVGKNPFTNGANCTGAPNSFGALVGTVDNVFVLSEALSTVRLNEIRDFGYQRIPTCATVFRQPNCSNGCMGDTISLSIDAGGSGGVTYQWLKNNSPIATSGSTGNPSAATSTLVLASVRGSDSGLYSCTVTNSCGSVTSATATVTVRNCCDSIDFNNDTSLFDPTDIDAFFSVFSEGPCIPTTATCNDLDFNNDGSLFDPCDIDSFMLVFSEGPCTLCGV